MSSLLDDPSSALALAHDRRLPSIAELCREVLGERRLHHAVGSEGAAPSLVAHALSLAGAPQVLYVAPDSDAASRAVSDLSAFGRGLYFSEPLSRASSPDAAPLWLQSSETTPYAEVHGDRRASLLRASALFQIARGLPFRFAVIPARSLVRLVVPPSALAGAGIWLEQFGELDLDRAALKLVQSGYLRVPVVEDPGTFAVRGGIVDVWPGHSEFPVRVELSGDLIEKLRAFDPDDQRTLHEVPALWLPPAREVVIDERTESRAKNQLRDLCDAIDYPTTKARRFIDDVSSGHAYFGLEGYLPAFYELVPLLDYFEPDAPVVIEDPASVVRAIDDALAEGKSARDARAGTPHFAFDKLYCERQPLAEKLFSRTILALHRTAVASPESATGLDTLEGAPPDAPSLGVRDHADLALASKAARSEKGKGFALEPLLRRLEVWREAGLDVTITARTRTQAERVAALLGHRGVALELLEAEPPRASRPSTRIAVAPLSRGALAPLHGFVLLTEEEIFGQRTHRAPERRSTQARTFLEDLRALAPGDLIVHADHGIGRYRGLEHKQVSGVAVDLIVIEYAGGDKLFLPVYRLNQVQKYSGGDAAPKLDRLGGQTFAKTKSRVEQRVKILADELLRLYAERTSLKKTPLPEPDDDYRAFEAGFPYDETRDQAAAISEVVKDLTSERVMDRLICGDVGFGKTEVALRAAFLTANAGRQVALLCPTTVLAQQHFSTFSSRLEQLPLTIRALSRFQTKTEQLDTLRGLKDGRVDVVVGTHRLLSKDVHFKNLGLLVVDEEQRFGVGHKERIKQLKASVDVLTLTATPIPRTLQFAVGGLRDMSLIATAPVDRRAIRTITSQFDPELVKYAIERELDRGGQVFYVYNRVEGLYERGARVQELVPRARVAVGHGQMSEDVLERTMLDFVRGEYDVLIATAIVESGLDIPRANTILIDRADLFGLSQLYQLRGRVGRGSERAYCYLLVPPPSQMTDESRARLEALERHSELGSGFQVAALDMELRGAGDVLGADQSGYVESVGFDLFCHMLEEATHELRGETVIHDVDPELNFDVEALLPESYVADVGVRLSLYKRLASARDEAEVDELSSELVDRFGEAPVEARRFVELMRLKTELRRLRVLGCEATAKSVVLHLRDDTPLDPIKLSALVSSKKSAYKLSPDGRLTRRATEGEAIVDGLVLLDKMLHELAQAVSTG
jgi:transcription-repair coupling factor (superfamily II helicase)